MKVYFMITEGGNNVVITDGETAKVYDAAPTGIFEGIDLYADDAADQIKDHFEKLYESGELNGYNEMYSENEVDFEDIEEELEDATLVFDTKQKEIPGMIEKAAKINGHFEIDGKKYVLIHEAYISGDHFESTAICTTDETNEDFDYPVYKVTFDITNENFEEMDDISDACDWKNPSEIEETIDFYDFETNCIY